MAGEASGIMRFEGNAAVAAVGILSIVVVVSLALGCEIDADLASGRLTVRTSNSDPLLP